MTVNSYHELLPKKQDRIKKKKNREALWNLKFTSNFIRRFIISNVVIDATISQLVNSAITITIKYYSFSWIRKYISFIIFIAPINEKNVGLKSRY